MIQLIWVTLMSIQNENSTTFAFKQLQHGQFMIVNDGVMGGRSTSTLVFNEQSLNFNGTLSLENNGGFASARMIWPFESNITAAEPAVLALKIKGDGLSYQFRLRTNRGFDGAAYSYSFSTLKEQIQTMYISTDEFVPKFRGRKLTNMPELKFSEVQQMGVLLADGQEGDFSIDLISLSIN